jgi:heme exporter protein A
MNKIKKIQSNYPRLAVKAANLGVKRGGRHVFEGITLELTNGTLLYLHGANGTGKSTLLRTLSGRLSPATGNISLQIDTEDATLNDNLMVLDHLNGLKNTFTLLEHCNYFVRIINGTSPEPQKIMHSLKVLKLHHLATQPIKYFSSGQRRRAALLKFLLIDRPIWLMDEPTVGVDAENRKTLAMMLEQHIKKGGAAIVATHDDIGLKGKILSLDHYTPKYKDTGYWS